MVVGCGLLCAAALASGLSPLRAEERPQTDFPVATDARLAGDATLTRFVLDIDRTIQFRAFTLDDPYRVVIDMPQISFHLQQGIGTAGRGLVKAFRYGMVMPGGSRIVFDLNGPARIASSYVLDAANNQPPRLVLELMVTASPTRRSSFLACCSNTRSAFGKAKSSTLH